MATLTLTVLRCPESVCAEQRSMRGGELIVGRGAECGWALPDPMKTLSRKHCTLEFAGGCWQVRDLSTNGTFVNFSTAPIGRDKVQQLIDGDRLRLGAYEIEVAISQTTVMPSGPQDLDPPSNPYSLPAAGPSRPAFASARLPGLDDPAPNSGAMAFGPASEPPLAIPDHAASAAEAFVPPAASAQVGRSIIPDDWYRDLLPPPPEPARQHPGALPSLASSPSSPSSPFDDPPAPSSPSPVLPPPAPPPPPPRPSPAPAPVVATAPAPTLTETESARNATALSALTVLLIGAELPPDVALRAASDPEATLRSAGQLLIAAVAGVRALLIARGSVKREFRIEQTMLRVVDNNPLKFAASDEQALAALLDPRKPALWAMRESIDDLALHQVAALAATQAAAKALLEKLAPAELEAQEAGGGGLFSGSREKRLWEAYKRRHAKLLEEFEDDFESAFGTAFARAYEQAAEQAKK
jgi:type VI secretion system protein ImpI/type VI secretion system protein